MYSVYSPVDAEGLNIIHTINKIFTNETEEHSLVDLQTRKLSLVNFDDSYLNCLGIRM